MKVYSSLFCIIVLSSSVAAQGGIITAAEANGTYRYRRNEIKILALGYNKLRIQMDLTFEYKSAAGPMANVGAASGEATIENDTAIFHPPDTQNCTITIKFLAGNKIKVTENANAECGFGMNVSSGGTYARIRAGKPKFDGANHKLSDYGNCYPTAGSEDDALGEWSR